MSEGTVGRVALVSGVCVAHDAISNALRLEAAVLRSAGIDVEIFVLHADDATAAEVTLVPHSFALANATGYRDADLAVFHFGVSYELFNALLLSGGPVKAVRFHNVTPPELLEGAAQGLAAASLMQVSIADRAAAVWADSEHNAEVLLAHADVDPGRVSVLELYVEHADAPEEPRRPDDGEPVRLLYVGRFVEAKGLDDLLDAVARLPPSLGAVSLVLAGSTTFSDPTVLDRLDARIPSAPAHVDIRIVSDPSDDELAELYRRAHVFVSSSRHEGFCIPVIEALAGGCDVVVTDAGALTDTVGGCGTVVPAMDPEAMAAAIGDTIASLRAEPTEADRRRRDLVLAHLRRFDADSFTERFLAAVDRAARSLPGARQSAASMTTTTSPAATD